MEDILQSVEIKQKKDGSWQAFHIPSGRYAHGLTENEALSAMKDLVGLLEDGTHGEPNTSGRFEGVAYEIARYLEEDISRMLSIHLGYARLEAYDNGIAQVRLGGGCEGCPSQSVTLVGVIKEKLQDKFSEDVVTDIMPM